MHGSRAGSALPVPRRAGGGGLWCRQSAAFAVEIRVFDAEPALSESGIPLQELR